MKSLSEQDHYEILETRPDATSEEIERCYRMALTTYADDSLAGYSVFEEGDAQALRDRIELAYRILGNAESRREYDETLGVPDAALDASLDALIAEASAPLETPILQEPPPTPKSPAQLADFEHFDDGDGDGDFDGARLRRYRMRSEMELEDIAGITKISPTYLRFIEEERFEDLPSKVYVRGFVTAYAQTLGLDSKRVAASYMKSFEEGQQDRPKGRFFEGR